MFMQLNKKAMNLGHSEINAAPKAAPVSFRVERELAVQVASIKHGLVREFGTAIGGNRDLLKSALNEAEAIAWQTPFPHLLFPVLAEEKASAVSRWAARQRSVRRASSVISLAE
jgi:hypothetical protein